MTGFSLSDLETIISERAHSGDPDSWTAKLYARGIE
ncbi:phosphoribosyl-ATP pyrophosphatase, partial [Mesorhizobium sp. B1-1-5]